MGRKQILQRNYDEEGNLISKECSCCNKIKLVSEFYKDKTTIDGLQAKCKKCFKEYYQKNSDCIKEKNKKYKQENIDKIKEYQKEYNKKYYQENIDKIKEYKKEYNKEYNKEYYKNNAERIKQHQKEHNKKYRKNNAEKIKEYKKQYRKDNAESIKEYKQEYYQEITQEALQQIKTEVESNPEKYNYVKDKEIYGIIYLVYNIKSNKYYVGQTTIGFDNRYKSGWLYTHGCKNSVKEDLKLYGKDSFKYTKIFKVAHSQYELDKLEAYYIDYYNSYENGYNETRGNIFTDRGKEI